MAEQRERARSARKDEVARAGTQAGQRDRVAFRRLRSRSGAGPKSLPATWAPTARPKWSSRRRPFIPKAAARSATAARFAPIAGRCSKLPTPAKPTAQSSIWVGCCRAMRRSSIRARRLRWRWTASGAMRRCSTIRRPISCITRCATCSDRMSIRRDRWSRPIACASISLTPARCRRRPANDRRRGQRAHPRECRRGPR